MDIQPRMVDRMPWYWSRRVLVTLLFSFFVAACAAPGGDQEVQPEREKGKGGERPLPETLAEGCRFPRSRLPAMICTLPKGGRSSGFRGERDATGIASASGGPGGERIFGTGPGPDFAKTRRAYAYHTYRQGDRLLNRCPD